MSSFDTFSISVTGLMAQSHALDNISGNIANSTTVGYKSVETSFSDMLKDGQASTSASGGVSAISQLTNAVQGSVQQTGIATNMALSGDGYLVVQANSGSSSVPAFSGQQLYTRRGDFAQDQNGFLVNGAGYYLAGTSFDPVSGGASGSGPIRLSSSKDAGGGSLTGVSIGSDGTISGSYSDGVSAKLGQATVAHFNGHDSMLTRDGGAYAATTASGAPTLGLNGTTFTGGAVEQSNTNIADQFSKLIVTQQAYQANTKALTAANEMLQDAVNILK